MCLLIVLHRVHADAPLIVAANRDEWLARDAVACAVLRELAPRTLGGKDLVAGGTWLAVNQHGVFSGLTNRPMTSRDPSKRSRGELPLALTAHESAARAVEAFSRTYRPVDYSPAWLFAADREALFVVDMTEGEAPSVHALSPGIHVLENRAWHTPSAKVRHVLRLLDGVTEAHGDALVAHLSSVLRDHAIPDGPADDSGVEGFSRPRETEACCVHAGPYGTRSSTIVVVPATGAPRLWTADGPPCTEQFVERQWSAREDESGTTPR